MRKILSIPLLLLVLFSGITVSFSTHFCGGYVAATKISLSGKQATCGMESTEVTYSTGTVITRHCCDNVISFYTLSSDYLLSSYFLSDPGQKVMHTFELPAVHGTGVEAFRNISDKIRPPGTFNPSMVEQQVICIFRI